MSANSEDGYISDSGGGWACAQCGNWVPSGEAHLCLTPYGKVYDQVQSYSPGLVSLDVETKHILRRIATALEKLAAEPKRNMTGKEIYDDLKRRLAPLFDSQQ